MNLEPAVGFLGFGNMGSAIFDGILERGLLSGKHIVVFDPSTERMYEAEKMSGQLAESPEDLARKSSTIILAVKPQMMDIALAEMKPGLDASKLLVSIAAGLSTQFILDRACAGCRIVRVMPNTPALVGMGAAAMAAGPNSTQQDLTDVRSIFEAVGIVEEVPEELIDVVTALSGSGPAYFFRLVECLIDAAVAQGLPLKQATRLAEQTALGAGQLLKSSCESAGTLRERVTSKGGTTEAALNCFAERGFRQTILAGVDAAIARAKELGK